ncbi:MAG: outer membrane lipoprotein-sorting protein [Pseudomonadales bacterium]|nr:outer membrane lipoprotein-sorting protein [Pseudomonadales bacterium]MCP5184500.1 outer membrane lipoprotein-sorting protein [Pseudomonadales bacterium]
MRPVVFLACLIISLSASADPRGLQVARAEYAASHGFGDLRAVVAMELVSTTGRVTERSLRLTQLETGDGRLKTLVVFELPKAIADTALLTWSNPLAEDDQWLYLPGPKRVKKIASKDRSGPFVGSTFAYEDLADYVVEEFEWQWLREEACQALVCDVVERRPKDPYSGYAREIVWIDRQAHRLRQAEYYDRSGALLKTLLASDFRAYAVGDRHFLQPHVLTMTNVQTGRATTLRWSTHEYGIGLSELRDFSTNALKRVR